MTVAAFLTPAGGALNLHRGAPELAGFAAVFDVLVAGDLLAITDAVLSGGSDRHRLLHGVTAAWGGPGTAVTIGFDTVADRIDTLTLGRAVPLPDWTRRLALTLTDARDIAAAIRFGDAPGDLRIDRGLGATAAFGPARASFRASHEGGGRVRIDLVCDPDSGPRMRDLLHLVGQDAHPDGDLRWMPDHLRDAALVGIETAALLFDTEISHLPLRASLKLRFLGGQAWPILPGLPFPEIGDLWARLDVERPLEPDLRFARVAIGGAILFDAVPQNRVEVVADWPGRQISGALAEGGAIEVGAMLARLGLPAPALPEGHRPLAIRALQVSALPLGAGKRLSIRARIDDLWSFPIRPGQTLDLAEVGIDVLWAAGSGFTGLMMARVRLPGDLDVALLARVDARGWVFSGGLETGAGGKPLSLGDWFGDLARWLGRTAPLPEVLADAAITRLTVEIDPASHRLTFALGCRAPLGGDAPLQVDLTVACSRGADGAWQIALDGTLVAGPLRLALRLDRGDATTLLAVLSLPEPAPVPFGPLIAALGGPKGIDLAPDLQAAAVAIAGGKTPLKLFATDIGAGVDLSNLPLVGPLVGAAGGLSVAFQLTLASRGLTAADQPLLDAINADLPPRATPLPAADRIGTGFGLSTTLLAGGEKIALNLPLKPAARGVPVDDPAAAPPPVAADGLKWIDLDRHFGPAHLKRLGLGYADSRIDVALDAELAMGPVRFSMTGLGMTTPIWPLAPVFRLAGLGLDFKSGPVEISGAFLRSTDAGVDRYGGAALIRTAQVSLSAIGEYAEAQGRKSLVLYAVLDTAIGGPAFFFVTGLAAGFGYNRRIVMPALDAVERFPLVAQAIAPAGKQADLAASLAAIRDTLPVAFDQHFLAVGVRFTTFRLIESFALLAVQFGSHVEIDLLGLSTLILPPPDAGGGAAPIAMAKVALKAVFLPDEGTLRVDAELTRDSFVLSRACHLTGGFSFYAWFKGARAGDFVVTLGGYHPAFRPPEDYPRPPRVGLNWQVDAQLQIKGDLYCALTPVAMMAGGHLEATYESGGLKAWFKAGLDLLIAWKPTHYDARVYVDVGGSYTFDFAGSHTITVDVGADLHIWGPEFSGTATVHLYVCSIDVRFGAGGPVTPQPITWDAFDSAFLHGPDKTTSIRIAAGLLGMGEDRFGPLARVAPSLLRLVTDSAIPAKRIDAGAGVLRAAGFGIEVGGVRVTPTEGFGVAPVGLSAAAFQPLHRVRVMRLKPDNSDDHDVTTQLFTAEAQGKPVPAALWGAHLVPETGHLDDPFAGNAVTGLCLTAAAPATPGQSVEVARDVLAAGQDAAPAVLTLAAGRPVAFGPGDAAARLAAIDAALADPATALRRRAVMAAAGLGAVADRPGNGIAGGLRAAPLILARGVAG